MQVAIAIACLKGVKLKSFIIKSSFGTSKYCKKFLNNAYCEALDKEKENKKGCPFIHFLERRRDLVVENDREFNKFLAIQAWIVRDYLAKIHPEIVLDDANFSSDCQNSLPSPSSVLGENAMSVLKKISSEKALEVLEDIKF